MRNEKQICCEFRYFHHVPGATDPQVARSQGRGQGDRDRAHGRVSPVSSGSVPFAPLYPPVSIWTSAVKDYSAKLYNHGEGPY